MKRHSVITYIFLLLIIGALSLGVVVGSVIYKYKTLSDGILGLSTLVLLYLFFVPPKGLDNSTNGFKVEIPRDVKYIPLSFFVTLIGTCALEYVIDFFSYLFDIFV